MTNEEDIMSEYTEDDYKDLCIQADYWGMESLTDEEQFVVDHFRDKQRRKVWRPSS